MQPGQLLYQRQSNASAFVGARPRTPNPMEPLERPGNFIRRNTNPSVLNTQHNHVSFLMKVNFNSALPGELEGIGKQVEYYFFPHLAIHKDGSGQLRTI